MEKLTRDFVRDIKKEDLKNKKKTVVLTKIAEEKKEDK